MLLTYQNSSEIKPSTDESQEPKRLHFYEKSSDIPMINQGVWQVYRGMVQLSKTHTTGEDVLLGWVQPLNFFGNWLTQVEAYEAKALSEVYLRWYDLDEIESQLDLKQTLLIQLVHRVHQSESLLAISGLRKVEDRLQELLKFLKREMGQVTKKGTKLKVRLTHQHLASAIGTTRVTVTRLLGDFQRQGLIHLDSDRHIILLDKNI